MLLFPKVPYINIVICNCFLQFLDMVRLNGLVSILQYGCRNNPTTASEVYKQFKLVFSSNQHKREQEEMVASNLETVMYMLEGLLQ